MRLLALAVVIALSGCFGIPEGGADFGDTVTVRYVAMDPDSGALLESRLDGVATTQVDGATHYRSSALANALTSRLGNVPSGLVALLGQETTPKADFDRALADHGLLMEFALSSQFELGSGESTLGFAGERRVVGMRPNETSSFVRSARDSDYSDTRRVDATVPGGDFVQTIPTADFRRFFHPDPQPGLEFEYNILHEARVESMENGTVRIRVLAEDGQTAPAEFVGVRIVTRVDEDGFHYELVPDPGARFIIRPPQGQAGTPLGLDPGGYRTRGLEQGQIVYDYTPALTTLPGQDVRFHVELVSVTPVQDAVPTGDWAQRRSPVLPGHHHGAADEGHDDHAH